MSFCGPHIPWLTNYRDVLWFCKSNFHCYSHEGKQNVWLKKYIIYIICINYWFMNNNWGYFSLKVPAVSSSDTMVSMHQATGRYIQ
jgi:hypothetical protein